jgi:hypothetical protein
MNDTPSETADLPPDLATLRARLEQAALQRLKATKWFPPFALAVMPDGNVVDYSVSLPADQATPELVYAVLVKGLAGGVRNNRFRAVGLCHGTVLKDGGRHAIRIVLEQPGLAREVIAPYQTQASGNATLEPGRVIQGKPAVFVPDDDI